MVPFLTFSHLSSGREAGARKGDRFIFRKIISSGQSWGNRQTDFEITIIPVPET
jgi:hypothetical protein